jgi:hypothetical protein
MVGLPILFGLNTSKDRTPTVCIFYNPDFIIYSSLGSFYIPCVLMVFLYYRIFSEIRRRAKKSSGQPTAARKQQPMSQLPPTTSVSDQAPIQRNATTQLQLHAKPSIAAAIDPNGKRVATLASIDRTAHDLEPCVGKPVVKVEIDGPRSMNKNSSLHNRFNAIKPRADSASSASAEASNSSTEDALPVTVDLTATSKYATVNQINNNYSSLDRNRSIAGASTRTHSSASAPGSEEVDSALVIENRQADIDFSAHDKTEHSSSGRSEDKDTISAGMTSLSDHSVGTRKRLLGRFARSAKMQEANESRTNATVSNADDLEMSHKLIVADRTVESAGREESRSNDGGTAVKSLPVDLTCESEVIENQSALNWTRSGVGGICVDCGGVCEHRSSIADAADLSTAHSTAIEHRNPICVIDIVADFSHEEIGETNHGASTGALMAETQFSCEIIANRSISLISSNRSTSKRCACPHSPLQAIAPEVIGSERRNHKGHVSPPDNGKSDRSGEGGRTSSGRKSSGVNSKTVSIADEPSKSTSAVFSDGNMTATTYLSASSAYVTSGRSTHQTGARPTDSMRTSVGGAAISYSSHNGHGTGSDLATRSSGRTTVTGGISSAGTELSSSGANSSSGGAIGAPETEMGDHGRLVVPSLGPTSGRHLSVANLPASSSTSGRTDASSLLGKKKSRFNLGRKQKSSRKKREKASAKRERKATKTLAIVLGKCRSSYSVLLL